MARGKSIFHIMFHTAQGYIKLFLATAIIFHCITPANISLQTDYPYLQMSHLLQSQPLLQCYYSLSSFPATLVAKLLAEERNNHAGNHSKAGNPSPANTSSDVCLNGSSGIDGQRIAACRNALPGSPLCSIVTSCPDALYRNPAAQRSIPDKLILLFLVAVIGISLPRGSPLARKLPHAFYSRCCNPLRSLTGRVFLLSQYPLNLLALSINIITLDLSDTICC